MRVTRAPLRACTSQTYAFAFGAQIALVSGFRRRTPRLLSAFRRQLGTMQSGTFATSSPRALTIAPRRTSVNSRLAGRPSILASSPRGSASLAQDPARQPEDRVTGAWKSQDHHDPGRSSRTRRLDPGQGSGADAPTPKPRVSATVDNTPARVSVSESITRRPGNGFRTTSSVSRTRSPSRMSRRTIPAR
jgi:hypothetical protein